VSKPRYSIIPGDFAEDPRADVGHFRVLNLIGRHTDEHGWCRLKQITIGNAVGVSRKTVNEKIGDLVAWGYVEKYAQDATGRAIWYRTIMDRHGRPPAISGDDHDGSDEIDDVAGPVTDELQVGCNSGDELQRRCNAQGVTAGVTTGRYSKNDPSLTTKKDSPLTPRAGGNRSKPDWKAAALGELRSAGRHAEAVEAFIAPLLESDKRLSLGADVPGALAEWAGLADGIAKDALRAAVGRLVKQRSKVQTADVRRELDLARKGGALFVARRGTPQWSAWVSHFKTADPKQATVMARFDVWQVPHEFPAAQNAGGAP
jgi:hypothetical protein